MLIVIKIFVGINGHFLDRLDGFLILTEITNIKYTNSEALTTSNAKIKLTDGIHLRQWIEMPTILLSKASNRTLTSTAAASSNTAERMRKRGLVFLST